MMKKKYLILLIVSIGFAFKLASQKNESRLIYKYTTEWGLSSNTVYQMLQDRFGFIWVGTEEGLSKFDGKNFTVFSVNKGRYSLSHNRTQAMVLAPDGNVWAGTSDGLNIYDYNSDSIIHVRTNTSPLKLIYNDITFLKLGLDKKKIWIGTYGNGVNYFDWKQKKFFALKLPKYSNVSPPLNVMSLLEDDNKRLWIGTRRNGLYRYDLNDRKLYYYLLPESSSFIRSIYQDNFKRIWIGTSRGCFIYNETSGSLDLVKYPEGLGTASIGSINGDRGGKIWIGTEQYIANFSVRAFSRSEKFPYQIIGQGESTSKLNCSSINSIFSDRDNNIWIGTVWGGVNMLQGSPQKFKLYKHDAEDSRSFPNAPVSSVCMDNKGDLLISADVMGIYKMNFSNGEFNRVDLTRGVSGYIYQAMTYDSEGNLWLGTYNNGLLKLSKNGAIRHYFFDNKNARSIPNNDIRCLYEGKDRSMWIGTSSGLARYDSKADGFERINSLNNLGLRSIKEAPDGKFWLGTYGGGVVVYDRKNNLVNEGPTSFNSRIVCDILINGDSIWLASMGEGLLLYIPSKKRGFAFTEMNGLSCNYVRSILRDKMGNIWMGTSKGISKLNPATKKIENFNSQDGLQNREFQERCAALLPNDMMMFGGFGGLNIFDPTSINANDYCPPVVFTKLMVFNSVITPLGKKNSPLKENITMADKIVLKHNQSVFTIEFMGINYNATRKIQYAYFLEGSDKRWNYVGTQNSVTFRNLHHGNYIFRVKASSPNAEWSDKNIASISIIVKPPFWQTWWAYLLYLVILGVILYSLWQFFTIRIRTENYLKIERAKRDQEEELHQEKLQFFTNISHEFRTPLTLLIGPLEKMQQEEADEQKKTHIRLMLRNAKRLLLMVNQLLDFRKADKGQMSLKVQYADIVAFINEVMLSFEELKIQKNIQFDFIHEEEVLMTWFDPEFIDKSLFNLLSNSFKFTPAYGSISVSVLEKKNAGNKYIEISVTDNGSGIQPGDIQNVFERFFQGNQKSGLQKGSGIGLHLTKNLIGLHHGNITVESTPHVKTTFTISIPSEQKSYSKEEISGEDAIVHSQMNQYSITNLGIEELKSSNTEESGTNRKKKILLVEDNPEIRSYIVDILGNNYEIEQAENGLVGLQLVGVKDYDLIISDLMMPEMDGLEMCKRLKSNIETNHIPIILLTAKSSIESRIEGLNVGADSYISKPFYPEHLVVRVTRLIELRDLLKQRFSRKISLGDLQNPDLKVESRDEQFLQKAISIILKKMMDTEFNGDVLANDMNLSRMGLYRKIKALTDQSTGEFIRNIRLKKACELLSVSGNNVSEVSYEVGFSSPSYFTSCFTEAFKMTPSEYIRNLKK